MNMKSILVYTIVGLLFLGSGQAQGLRPLNVGDICPDVFFGKIINSDVTHARLSDFQGKWVVLYFWGTGCSSCILKMPSIDRLQKEYANDVAIFTITYNSEAEIANLWAKSPAIKARNIPLPGTITDDSIMRRYFPNSFVPYLVWIDPQRKVREITDGSYLTKGALNRILDGDDLDWLPLLSLGRKYSMDSLFLQPKDNGAGLPSMVYYSTITSYLHGIPSAGSIRDTLRHGIRRYYTNNSILALYDITLTKTPLFALPNRVILRDVRDSSRYFHLDKNVPETEWERIHHYCYEAVLPTSVSERGFYASMRHDLDKFFGMRSEIKEIKKDCLFISRLNENTSKNYEPLAENDSYSGMFMRNIVRIANHQNPGKLIVFDKNIKGMDLIYCPDSLRFRLVNGELTLEEHRRILNENGYDIQPARKQVEFLILTEQ